MKYFTLSKTLFLAFCIGSATAQEAPKKENTDKKATIAEKTKACKKFEGLFNIYQDTTNGNLMMGIKKDQIGKEFIYFAYTENGIAQTGHNRGIFRDNRVFTLKKYYDKIEIISKNINFYFDKNNAISKSSEANISDAVLLSLKINVTDSAKGEYLVDAGNIYMSEALHPVKPNIPPMLAAMMFNLGSLNKDKSKVVSVKNYPMNTDVVVDMVYDNPSPSNGGGSDVADARSVTIRLQHSLIEMPQNGFKPRRDDPRVGYFMTDAEDMTSASATPFKDVIHRWNLEKKDKGAAMSEPVEPITWWIENTTPIEFKPVIKAAALTWNLAFEKAGFKNAIKVEEQPDDATWDAGDIRYNVLRWTSSPFPPFGGYGPSFVNPRSGQILGADIMFEYVFVTNRLKQENLFAKAGMNFEEEANHNTGNHCCQIGDVMQHNMMLGRTALTTTGATEIEIQEYIKQSLYYLVLHEMGHTFGLNHNMRASTMLMPNQLNDKAVTDKLGLTASVMDYPAINLALDKSKQGLYFTNRPGPYDLWAIEYGYSEGLDNEKEEETRLQNILNRSTDSLLIFGNDADDMRGSFSGIDPRVNIGDMSKDVLSYSSDRFKLVDNLLKELKTKYTKNGQSWQEMRQAYMILTGEMASAATVVSRYVGGVYTDRSFIGQPGAGKPYTAVPLAEQKKAMSILSKNIFSPSAFAINEDLASYLQLQRRGFNFFGNSEEPKIHDRVLAIQSGVLSHLTSSTMLHRLTESRLFGNKYYVNDMLADLTNSLFKEDQNSNVNTFRQNVQIYYVKRLIMITESSSYDEFSKAAATAQLTSIKQMTSATSVAAPTTVVNGETKSHKQYLNLLIKKSFEK